MANEAPKETTEIGTAIIDYHEDGTVAQASFIPAARVTNLTAVQAVLNRVVPKTAEDIKVQAETVFAEWFNAVQELEDIDREIGRIEAIVLECVKWANERPRHCKIRFDFVTN